MHGQPVNCTTPPTGGRRLGFVFACSRGSAVSVFDYADSAATLLSTPLKWPPLLVCVRAAPGTQAEASTTLSLFRARFGSAAVVQIDGWAHRRLPSQLDELCCRHGVTDLYWQKVGSDDGVVARLPWVRNLVHAVFKAQQPHGAAYAAISSTLPGACGGSGGGSGGGGGGGGGGGAHPLASVGGSRCAPVVPYIVRHGETRGDDLRAELGLPPTAAVFCRHGGQVSSHLTHLPLTPHLHPPPSSCHAPPATHAADSNSGLVQHPLRRRGCDRACGGAARPLLFIRQHGEIRSVRRQAGWIGPRLPALAAAATAGASRRADVNTHRTTATARRRQRWQQWRQWRRQRQRRRQWQRRRC